jgi:hypothetical protein
LNVWPCRAVNAERAEHHLAVTQDRAQDIVVIMRNPAHQPADRLHLLGLAQSRLDFFAPRFTPLAIDRIGDHLAHGIDERDVCVLPTPAVL